MSLGSFVSGLLGGQNDFHQSAYTDNTNDYQYGGVQGGAAAAQNRLQQLGATGTQAQQYSNSLLANAAAGNGPSAAQAQLQQGLAASQAASAAQAASSRGGGSALAAAQNQAANTQAAQGVAAANSAAQLRAQEMQAAQGQYAQQATAGAGIQQGYEAQANQIGAQQLQAQQNLDAAQAANYNQASAINANVASGNASAAGGVGGSLLGAGASAASSALSSSDANAKMDITPQFGSAAAETAGGAAGAGIGAALGGGAMGGGGAGAMGTSAAQTASGAERPGGGGDMFSAGNYATPGANKVGEAQLAARDAHTANFAQMGNGMGNWFNASNAQPWSPEASAAQANLSHYFNGGAAPGKWNGGGQGDMLSDEATKTKDSMGLPNAADELLEKAKPYAYRYKPGPAQQYGSHLTLGPMAQDIERTSVGASMVHDTPQGKMVDTKKAAMAAMAMASRVNDKLEAFMRGDK